MSASISLFSPLQMRALTLPNRIVVAPMCQYSAVEGVPQPWHVQHLGSLATSGPGLLMVEATAVEHIGRITHACTGLYSDACEEGFTALIKAVKSVLPGPVGIQLAHSGRKGSTDLTWKGGKALTAGEGAWETIAPSALAFGSFPAPKAMDLAAMDRVVRAYVDATKRAHRAGFDLIELHCAHGYLINEFLSPVTNRRADVYGGPLINRVRFPLEVAAAMRAAWPEDKPMGIRVSATDWLDDGWSMDDSVVFAAAAKELGIDYCCASSGGILHYQEDSPGFQVAFAERIRRETGILTRAVGRIVTPREANAVIANGQADMVALGRAFLANPRWVWHAADKLGMTAQCPPQYLLARPDTWAGNIQ